MVSLPRSTSVSQGMQCSDGYVSTSNAELYGTISWTEWGGARPEQALPLLIALLACHTIHLLLFACCSAAMLCGGAADPTSSQLQRVGAVTMHFAAQTLCCSSILALSTLPQCVA